MAETFNPIISHLYSGQGGVSREITKYNNGTISEINFKENGVTTKYDFGGLFNEKMFTGNRVWKQLFNYSSVSSVSANGVTITNNNDGSFTVYTDENGATANTMTPQYWISLVGDHKYAIVGIPNGASSSTYGISGTDNIYTNSIRSYSGDYGRAFSICVFNGAVITTPVTFRPQLFDLTDIYGVGNEPTTIAEFVHKYSNEYYPYDPGTPFSTATELFRTIKQPLDSIKFYGNTMRWCQYANCTNPTTLSQAGNVISSELFSFNTSHKYAFVFDWSFQTTYSGVKLTVGIWNNSMTIYNRKIFNADVKSKRYVLLSDGVASLDNKGGGTLDYTSVKIAVQVVDNSGEVVTPSNNATISNVQCFDLTYIFGAGNEPTTVSDFTRRLKKLYYPFTNGEILSIEKASEYLYGINIWDEEWEAGGINSSTGLNENDSTRIRSKNYIPVLLGETYYFLSTKALRVAYYDCNKAYLGETAGWKSVQNGTLQLPDNCFFIRFVVVETVAYNHDICINLSDSSINGTYEASKGEQKMQLDSFNVWDEEWELGTLNNGQEQASSTAIRAKNYTRTLPNETYYATSTNNEYINIAFYDGNKTFISDLTKRNQTFTTPSNCEYIRIYFTPGYGTTYNNDICINLSDPSRNGIYVPYRKYVELNGINDVIDTVTVEKNVTLPFGLVDLGELTWYYLEASGHEAMYSTGIQSSAKHPSSDSTVANIVCGAFSTVTRNQQYNHSADFIIAMNTDGTLFVYSTTMGTTGALFKNSVKGKYLYYELADHPLNDAPILAGSYVRSAETVDMGTLDWNYNSDRQEFYATISDAPNYTNNVLCSKYSTVPMSVIWTGAQDKVCSMQNNYIGPSYSKRIVVRDTSYTDATTFKASVQGATLCYELETPVETTLTAQQCAEILNGAFTKSKYSTLLTDNDNGQIDQTVDVGMWEQR